MREARPHPSRGPDRRSSGSGVFVVGVPRSGTTLLAAMLARHSRLACGPETNFFALARRANRRALLDPAAWPVRAVEWLSQPVLEGESLLERYGLRRDLVASRLERRAPSLAAILEGVLDEFLERVGKQRWIEKSPIHLLHLDSIRRHFPDAIVVSIARDPRDVALSLTKVPWGPRDFAGGLLYWRRFDEGGARFLAADAKSVTVRYEDLMTDPEGTLRALCGRLGEPFEDSMLHAGPEADALRRPHERWKEGVTTPLDPSRSHRWRSVLDDEQMRLADLLVGDRLAAHGYPQRAAGEESGYACVRPRTERLSEVPGLIDELAAGRLRIWRRAARERPDIGIYVGSPDQDGWLGYGRLERLRAVGSILRELVELRAAGRRVRWIRRPSSGTHEGFCGRLIVGGLALLANERIPAARLEPCR